MFQSFRMANDTVFILSKLKAAHTVIEIELDAVTTVSSHVSYWFLLKAKKL